MWLHCIRCFLSSSSSCRKVGKSKRQAVPEDSMHLTHTCTPPQEAFKMGLKNSRKFCISFSFARISDAIFTLALSDQETGCLWFAHSFPQSPALFPGCASSCLPTNKKCCTRPNHGGEGFVTSVWTLPGIQHQDQDLKPSNCICCGTTAVLLAYCKLLQSKWGKNAPWNLIITLISFC